MDCKSKLWGTGLAVIAAGIACEPAMAQAPADESTSGEIIVTARKREETSIAVPVVLTAVSGAQLERRGVVRLDDVIKLVPQLMIGTLGGGQQGGQVSIRGIAGAEVNPFADQAVAFNIDGVQVARGNIRRLAQMDIGVMEVLKGPQALFFGKNSPGGVISIRSADPTRTFQAKASAGYEFNAHEWRGDGFISGPITDTLGARVALFGTTMRGWFRDDVNTVPAFNATAARVNSAADKWSPKTREFAVRGILKWEPSNRFNARLSVSYDHLRDNGILNSSELYNCPAGSPQLGGGPDNCKIDRQGARPSVGSFLATLAPDRYPEDGQPFLKQKQALVSSQIDYNVTDALTLTSVTGYYYLRASSLDSFTMAFNPAQNLVSVNVFGNDEFSQELRLRSNYDGPTNFLIGGYYQKSKVFTGNTSFIGLEPVNGINPNQLNNYLLKQRGQAYSWFGQVSLKPTDQIEVTAGGRYSYERKRLPLIATQTGPVRPGPLPRVVLPPDPRFPRKDSWTDFSPEFTISYRPSPDLTVFASHKRGFLSGGFNSGATNFNSDLRFDQQVIKGFEGGVKAALFNRALRVNLAAYRYIISGLQISSSVTTATGVVQTVENAGKVTIKGLEGDFNYRTPIHGLSIHGAAGYNDAKYNIFTTSCWTGQLQEEGCNSGLPSVTTIAGQTFTTFPLQNLAGQPLLRAPKWTGNIGVSFDHDIGSNLRFALDGDMSFSSSYFMNIVNSPRQIQKSYQLLDASARVGAQDESWEVALIGHNLSNELYGVKAIDVPFTGSGQGRAATDSRGRVLSDELITVNRGREIMLRLTVRYGGR